METPQEALSRAKIHLMTKPGSVFYTHLCFSLKHLWDDTIKTACTNGKEIRFNTKFFMDLSFEERVFLLVHESMHVAYVHMERVQDRDAAKFNVAADHCINLQLIEAGFKMPSVGLADPQYKGMSTEQIYDLLPTQDPSKTDMDIQPFDGDPEELQSQVEEILVRAALQSEISGDKPETIPGGIQIFLNGLLRPKLPWNRILQRYLTALTKNDYSFRKPNRRFFPQYHLPSMTSESLMDIAVAIDTSGSVTPKDFQVFVSETHSIIKFMKPKKISLIRFDTVITGVDNITSIQDLSKVTFFGQGGTDIKQLMDWSNENKPKLLLVFTDGYFPFYGYSTDVNTVWIIHNNPKFNPPFGKVIHYLI